jgi:hypothetical protein
VKITIKPPHLCNPQKEIDTTKIVVYWHRVLAVPNRQNLDELRNATYFWYKDGVLLPQSNRDWIEVGPPIPAGTYTVSIVYNGAEILFLERTIDEPYFGVLAYPNPLNLSDELNVEAHTTIRRIEISINGVVQKLPIRVTDKGYAISGFSTPGVYILQVHLLNPSYFGMNSVETIKIVVQ